MPAASAFIEMAAECGGTTPPNGQQHFDMLPKKPVAVSFDERSSSGADQICDLEQRPGHWGTSSPNVTHTYIKTAWQSLLRSPREASAAQRLRANAVIGQVTIGTRREGVVAFSRPYPLSPLCVDRRRKGGNTDWR